MRKNHRYTKDQIEYIREIAPNNTCDEIVEKFNNRYSLNQSKKSLKCVRERNGIKVGKFNNPTSFKKGVAAWNKGLKGFMGANKTSFKKGYKHPDCRPVGSETHCKDGWVRVKTADPNTWRRKHQVVWEEANGKVPKGYSLLLADGDKSNNDLDNIILVSRGQLSRLGHNKLLQNDTELTKTMLNVVKLYEVIDIRSGKYE